jgi:hypothetical protein
MLIVKMFKVSYSPYSVYNYGLVSQYITYLTYNIINSENIRSSFDINRYISTFLKTSPV